MQRQKHSDSRHGISSTESILGQRGGHLYCERCRHFVGKKQAVSVGKGRFRCPACGEPLQRREGPNQNGHAGNS